MLFYDLMNYNYPENKEYFKINPDLKEWIVAKPIKLKSYSSDVSEYEKFIKKYQWLFKYLPFVRAVYVSNSVSFKSVHKNSDIDLFFVIENDRLHIWRFFVKLIFKLLKIEWNHHQWKFCTGFWVTKYWVDMYPISIFPVDIYLAYWIAHLQPIYWETFEDILTVFKENFWVKNIIPAYDAKPQKIIDVEPVLWKSFVKKVLEKIFWFNWLNFVIWFFWKKKMLKEKQKLWKKWENIIISDNILKFFAPDKRQIVYLKYKALKPHFLKKTHTKGWKIKKTNEKIQKDLFS